MGNFDYDNVSVTTDADLATHCRMISNMIPNHAFGLSVTGPNGDGWINPIDHSDTEITYIPVRPVRNAVPSDTPRNPPVFDLDGILLLRFTFGIHHQLDLWSTAAKMVTHQIARDAEHVVAPVCRVFG